jgi:hypothetical protein
MADDRRGGVAGRGGGVHGRPLASGLSHACRMTVPETGHTPGPGTLRLGGGAGADPCRDARFGALPASHRRVARRVQPVRSSESRSAAAR